MQLVGALGYAGIVALMFAENVFPPIPSEFIMPLAGYLASRGELQIGLVVAAGTAGAALGALPLYYLGRRWGARRVRDFAERHGRWLTVRGDDIDAAARWFARHGRAAVFFGRLVPGVRSLISIPAGIAGMPLPAFLAFTAAGAALWTAFLACAGYLVGARFHDIDEWLDPVSWGVFALIVALYLYRVARHKGQRR